MELFVFNQIENAKAETKAKFLDIYNGSLRDFVNIDRLDKKELKAAFRKVMAALWLEVNRDDLTEDEIKMFKDMNGELLEIIK